MSELLCECKSLKSLPNLSKWKMENVKDLKYFLSGCSSLVNLCDISKWNTLNLSNLSYLIERDGVVYSEAYDPIAFKDERIYTETNIKIEEIDTEVKEELISE